MASTTTRRSGCCARRACASSSPSRSWRYACWRRRPEAHRGWRARPEPHRAGNQGGTRTMTEPTSKPDDVSRSETPGVATDRRGLLLGAAAATGLAGGFTLPTYLRDFTFTKAAMAQGSGPVKMGFIEDE